MAMEALVADKEPEGMLHEDKGTRRLPSRTIYLDLTELC